MNLKYKTGYLPESFKNRRTRFTRPKDILNHLVQIHLLKWHYYFDNHKTRVFIDRFGHITITITLRN